MEKRSSSGLFLMEFLIAFAFFAVAAAACVSIFVGAHRQSRESAAPSLATAQSARVAETYFAEKGDLFRTADALDSVVEGNGFVLYFNERGLYCAPANALVTLRVTWVKDRPPHLAAATLEATYEGRVILTLPLRFAKLEEGM